MGETQTSVTLEHTTDRGLVSCGLDVVANVRRTKSKDTAVRLTDTALPGAWPLLPELAGPFGRTAAADRQRASRSRALQFKGGVAP